MIHAMPCHVVFAHAWLASTHLYVDVVMRSPEHPDGGEPRDEVGPAKVNLSSAINLQQHNTQHAQHNTQL
jgi:hypothetical protein